MYAATSTALSLENKRFLLSAPYWPPLLCNKCSLLSSLILRLKLPHYDCGMWALSNVTRFGWDGCSWVLDKVGVHSRRKDKSFPFCMLPLPDTMPICSTIERRKQGPEKKYNGEVWSTRIQCPALYMVLQSLTRSGL